MEVAKNIVDFFGNLNKHLIGKQNFVDLKDKVIVLFIDGLTLKQASYLIKKLNSSKSLRVKSFSSLKSLNIPSTSTVIPSINLLTYPFEHGSYSWTSFFEPSLEVIYPLPYWNFKREPINTKNHLLFERFKNKNFYSLLKEKSLKSLVVIKQEYSFSKTSKALYYNSSLYPFWSLSQIFSKLKKEIKKESFDYMFIYLDDLDIINHIYGPNSRESKDFLNNLIYFLRKLKTIGNYSLIIVSDHGHKEILKKKVVKYDLKKFNPLFDVGEVRNRFIKVEEDKIDKVYDYFENLLKKKKLDYKLEILNKKTIKELLGGYSKTVEHLINSLFIQLKEGVIVKKGSLFNDKSWHGGYSEEEINVPFIIF